MAFNRKAKFGIGCLGSILLLGLAVFFVNKRTIYEGKHSATQGNTVSIILIDGLGQERFQKALQQNDLPNLKGLIEEGSYVENGIGSFPSMTGYAFYPFITGHDALESGIIGLRWFDRSLDKGNLRNYVGRTNVWMNQDITDTIKNFFELSGDQYTATINSFMNRGTDDARITGWMHTTAKFEGKSFFGPLRSIPLAGVELAKNHFQHESEVMRMAMEQLQQNPKVQWISLPSPDATFHIDGMTDNYNFLVAHIDSLIGDFRNSVSDLGQDKTRMIAVVTDHGIAHVDKNIDFLAEVKSKIGLDLIRGNAVNYRSMQLNDPLSDFVHKDGYFVINGNLSSMLYLKDPSKEDPESWRKNISYSMLTNYPIGEKTINIPKAVASIKGMELVLAKNDDGTVMVFDKEGMATISKKENRYIYHPINSDPLHYENLGLSDTLLTQEDWLSSTIQSDFPDAIYRIYSLMQSPIVGDLVMTSLEGYDFARDYEVIVGNYKGGHGGIHADQLRVPYILYQPGQNPQKIPYARAEEVGLSIKKWLSF